MSTLLLKLLMAPLIIGTASLASRRWGPAVSGWILGMPIISGPVVFIISLSHDAAFTLNAALGVLSGGLSLVSYALVFSWLAARFRWPFVLGCSLVLFAATTLLLQNVVFPFWLAFLLVTAAILAGLRLLPRDANAEVQKPALGRWDIPVRILIGTAVILLITGIAPYIGPRLSGLLTTIPLYVTILGVFALREQGGAFAAHLFRGLLHGMFAFTAFYITLGILLPRAGNAVSFLSATLIALAVQGGSLWVLQRTRH